MQDFASADGVVRDIDVYPEMIDLLFAPSLKSRLLKHDRVR